MKKKPKTIWGVRGALKVHVRDKSFDWKKMREQIRVERGDRQIAILNATRKHTLRAPKA